MIFIIVAASLLVIWLLIHAVTGLGFQQFTQMRLYHFPKETLADFLLRTGTFTKEKYESMSPREVQTLSSDGLLLNGQIFEPYPNSGRWVLIAHGYTLSLRASMEFAALFEEKGFNMLLIDQRRHGKSQGKYTTLGYREKLDIKVWVDYLIDRFGPDIKVGLHGQSLGGATILEYLSMADPVVKFAVADCAFSDLNELLCYQITSLIKLPHFPFIRLLDRKLYAKFGFRLEEVSPIKSVTNCRQPILFIHGEADRYVPAYMSRRMYEAKPGVKELVLIPGANHAVAYNVDPKRYKEAIHRFVDEHIVQQELAHVDIVHSFSLARTKI